MKIVRTGIVQISFHVLVYCCGRPRRFLEQLENLGNNLGVCDPRDFEVGHRRRPAEGARSCAQDAARGAHVSRHLLRARGMHAIAADESPARKFPRPGGRRVRMRRAYRIQATALPPRTQPLSRLPARTSAPITRPPFDSRSRQTPCPPPTSCSILSNGCASRADTSACSPPLAMAGSGCWLREAAPVAEMTALKIGCVCAAGHAGTHAVRGRTFISGCEEWPGGGVRIS